MSLVLKNFIIKLKKDVYKNLQSEEQKKASKNGWSENLNSKLSASIETALTPSNEPIDVQLFMNEYWFWVDGGRKPGNVSEVGQTKIADWVKRKGVNPSKIIDAMREKAAEKKGLTKPKKETPFAKAQKQFAFIVARNLKVKGYKANHFYSKIINDGRLDQLHKDLLEEQGEEIMTKILINGSNNSK